MYIYTEITFEIFAFEFSLIKVYIYATVFLCQKRIQGQSG